MPGFASPGVLFAGNSYGPERRFYRPLLESLRVAGYRRFVEPCAGAFAVSLIAADVGWKPTEVEASDVSLFSGVLGHYLSGRSLDDLGVRVDGELLTLPDEPVKAAAEILWTQLRLRMEAKPDVDYWKSITRHLVVDRERITASLVEQMTGLGARLSGLSYESLDLAEHIARAADDPKAVIVAAPPTYTAGFERFYATDGRLTWDEPEYGMFDPAVGCNALYEQMADAKALFLLYQEDEVGSGAAEGAVFARPAAAGRNAYVRSNRPSEVFTHTGGLKIAPLYSPPLLRGKWPMLPPGYEVTRESRIEMIRVESAVAEFYRRSWMHRLAEGTQGDNLLVLIDGFVAGAMAFSNQNIAFFGNSPRLMLTYCLSPTHPNLRLTRLMLMLAQQRTTARAAMNPRAHLYVDGSTGLSTTNFTRYPESKQMRGLMKMTARKQGKDGFELNYECDWAEPATESEVLAQFLTIEERRKGSAK